MRIIVRPILTAPNAPNQAINRDDGAEQKEGAEDVGGKVAHASLVETLPSDSTVASGEPFSANPAGHL